MSESGWSRKRKGFQHHPNSTNNNINGLFIKKPAASGAGAGDGFAGTNHRNQDTKRVSSTVNRVHHSNSNNNNNINASTARRKRQRNRNGKPKTDFSTQNQAHHPNYTEHTKSAHNNNNVNNNDNADHVNISSLARHCHNKKSHDHSSTQQKQPQDATSIPILKWISNSPLIPLTCEQDMLKVILRWGVRERGMLKDQPPFRVAEIQKRCHRNHMHISQACSLRRHHMCLLHPFKSKEALRLGTYKDIRQSAELFEQAIGTYLQRQQIAYYTEGQQKEQFLQAHPGELVQATPDFKLQNPVLLQVFHSQSTAHHHNNPHHTNNNHNHGGKRTQQQQQQQFISERTIHWIEAKMFYGASTIPHDDKSAVGCILSKMKKYAELYGPGAIVFMQGCGEQLATELNDIGVTALSCPAHDIDLSAVKRHQRTWCADPNGNILP